MIASNPEVLDSAADVTPEWMTAVLQSAGVDAVVSDVAVAPVGTGQMADSSRIKLSYETAAADAPPSVVGKFPSTDPASRASGGRGGYGTEVNFYKHIAGMVSGRIPNCLFAEVGEPEEFTLILEDMAPAEQGNQMAGCSLEHAEAALVNLAGFHGPLWNHEKLSDPMFGGQSDNGLLAEFMAAFTPAFIERYAEDLSDDDKAMCTDFAARVVDWHSVDTGANSIVHGDYRLDNLLFGTSDTCPPVTAVDWQTARPGPALRDVGYFLGTSLDAPIRAEHEEQLVRTYHAALLSHGVDDYDFDRCWDDYRLGSLHGPLITILGSMGVVRTERGDKMFMAMILRSGHQVRDLDALSLF